MQQSSFLSNEEWTYLLKVGGACTLGAAVVKYGSLVLPSMTQPNLGIALIIVFTPATIGACLLAWASR